MSKNDPIYHFSSSYVFQEVNTEGRLDLRHQ